MEHLRETLFNVYYTENMRKGMSDIDATVDAHERASADCFEMRGVELRQYVKELTAA